MSGNGGKAGRDHVFMRQVTHQESTNMVNPGHGGSGEGVGSVRSDGRGFVDKGTIKTIGGRMEILPCLYL